MSEGSAGCRLVGIGASAGGLDSFSRLLRALPARIGLPIVLTQHLDPAHESHLAEILSHASKMPVVEAVDGARVENDHVYVMPANAALSVSDGLLRLEPLDSKAAGHLIDGFLESLAAECRAGAVGVILSGTGSDGTRGLAAIAQAGGLAFAQDPETAQYEGMPQSAVDSGVVATVLSPEELAQVLVQIGANEYTGRPGNGAVSSIQVDDSSFAGIVDLLRSATGLDLSGYRQTSLVRRVSRRMLLVGIDSMRDYLVRLQADPSELSALYRDVLVNVTEFFRDPDALESLKDHVFPGILASLAEGDKIRVWVPGCSRGQEAYSLAILLMEFFESQSLPLRAQVFATDVNRADIEAARAGVYLESIELEVSPERLSRHFSHVPGGYRVNQAVRDLCMFAVHDVVQDPPFSRLDLVSFRNVLIYMERPLQQRVFQVLHYALKPGGFLLLGSAEAATTDSALFSIADKAHRVYVRNPGPSTLLGGLSPRERREPLAMPVIGDVSMDTTGPTSELDELRTINEEFQTAQEELQSTNEELTTLNDELRIRNTELVELTDDLNNVLEGAEIPLLILDKELKIRRFTPQSGAVVSILPTDVGRPITDFRFKVAVPDFVAAVEEVVRTAEPAQSEVMDEQGHWYSMRIRPYRTESGELDGAVVAFFDVDALKSMSDVAQANAASSIAAREHADAVVEAVRDPLLTLGSDFGVRGANRAFYSTFAMSPEQTVGVPLAQLGNGQWNIPALISSLADTIAGRDDVSGLLLEADFEGVGRRSMVVDATKIREEQGEPMILLSMHDVTDLKRQERLSGTLLGIGLTVSSTLELNKVLDHVVRDAAVALGAESGAIFVNAGNVWSAEGTHHLPRSKVRGELTLEDVAVSMVAGEKKTALLIDDVSKDERFKVGIEAKLRRRAVLVAPLLFEDELVGSVGFHFKAEGRTFSAADASFATSLAALLALALENARRYAAERQIATTLQAALLTTPRRIAGLEFGYLYRSATDSASVGGDFYDLIELDNGRAGLLIGDVSGKGIAAATLTSLVKNTVRALAYDCDSPAQVLARTSDIIFKSTPLSTFVTVLFCVLDISSGHMVYCSAGHPRAMLRRRGGRVDLLHSGSPMAGAFGGVKYTDDEAQLAEGDLLVLYTDGVTEARRDGVMLGEDVLTKFVRDAGAVPTREAPQTIFDRVLAYTDGRLSDDVAIVAVSRAVRGTETV